MPLETGWAPESLHKTGRLIVGWVLEQDAIGIVALARRLLIELWRFLQTGALPEGATASS